MLTYKFDAENRMVASCPSSDGPTTCTNQAAAGRTLYGYDGEGRRVTKQTANATPTTYIYDAMGDLAAEYGGTVTANGPEFLTADQLGSTRVVTNAAKGIVARHDFRPFGDEIPGTGIRQGITGYNQDGGVRQEFTGKERDAETGLDYFGARYFSAAQGRFTSPDELIGGVGGAYEVGGSRPAKPGPLPYADVANPQSLNKYVYALNNPLRYIDPDGHDPADPNDPNKAPKPTSPPKQPAPTTPEGKPAPPPVRVPGAPNLGWRWVPDATNPRGGTWRPTDYPKTPGGIPSGSWDPGSRGGPGHWDIDDGNGNRNRYDPNGNPLTPDQVHPNRTPAPGAPGTPTQQQIIDPQTAAKGAAAIGTGALIYWIISEGSRIVFPPRNLIPIP